jgi:hypothetical protein
VHIVFCFAAADECVFVYIYCISHSCPLHSLTLSWYNLFIGSSDSAEQAPPQTVSAFVFSFSQALSGLSVPEL